ncbi:MAG TPA: hypothetical protein VMC79_05075 [Rectinemataceae bacterium]|nr:hypothetical protein [Rectinemataceae bacterium]
MGGADLVLGIDSSTQSTSAVIVDRNSFALVAQARVRYRDDPRLGSFGLTEAAPILPPREPGEADQPATLFLAALDALLEDLPREALARLAAVNVSAQQHGQVWLAADGAQAVRALRRPGSGATGTLAGHLGCGFADDRAPIWMSADTEFEAAELRSAAGGGEAMTALSGSDSPLRFSGAVMRRRARRFPERYERTTHLHLLSSFLTGVLRGDPDAPIDWGNGSGTSLMDWRNRCWAPQLLFAASLGLAGGLAGLEARLPPLVHPLHVAGGIAAYFTERYGIPGDCAVVAGSGDNPQSKVLAEGSLLSLGTSFVLMSEGGTPHRSANAMYDGLGRPFLFGCRTNGALVWESLRRAHGLAADDFAASDAALETVPPGAVLRLLQPERESFPASGIIDLGGRPDFAEDYAGAVDSSLGLLVLASEPFAARGAELAVTGGAAASRAVLKRIANLWGTRVLPIADAGAATGAAVAAACALVPEGEREELARRGRRGAAQPGSPVEPDAALSEACRKPGGYLERLAALFAEATGAAPASFTD